MFLESVRAPKRKCRCLSLYVTLRRVLGSGGIDAKIVKTDRSPYDERLGQTFKGEETTGGVRIVVDEKGNQAILGLGETLRTQYYGGSPAIKLMTLRDAQRMAVLRLEEKGLLPTPAT